MKIERYAHPCSNTHHPLCSVNGACVVYRHVNSDISRKVMCFPRFSSVLEPYYTCLTRLFKNLFMILGIPVIKVDSINSRLTCH